ncbi:MAG: hypothetical protein HOB14_02410 [Gammaproteobacteria bacterium]|jgi:cytochrome c553|nr:hypothetical protein [Gammaproteobacteria bacterium]MBT7082498.1 hypothetical protein [Chloroflexota bacterium]MBT4193373.1 hypothetical protein [Gammaproteobacteria bacterium]MBT4449011.1 hypothetical protein [Gammaproteobacteria bacterium]MBT4859479.1 hypothetical protein [Gammaproteobacteria bacterium]
MRLILLFLLLISDGVLAAVNHQAEYADDVSPVSVLDLKIPVNRLPGDELGLLKQLTLKTHSSEENLQHLWNRVKQCESCHSLDMYARNGYLPILQGQNLEYLFSKLLMFKNNRRSFHPLGSYLESLSNNDLMDISYFYSRQQSDLGRTLVPADIQITFDQKLDRPGQAVSIQGCSECHGVTGNGGQLIPSISGQNKNYLSYRIREIADEDSRVHFTSDAPVSCKIDIINVRQSRQLASLLSVVVDQQSVEQGAAVYRSKCAECHDAGQSDEESSEQAVNWSRHLLLGTRLLVYNAQVGGQHKYIEKGKTTFSRNEMKHAIHYMINELLSSL